MDERAVEAAVARAGAGIPHYDDDYIGEDGMLWCGKCHTPKQRRVTIVGREYRPMMMCRCEQARYDAEKAEAERRKHEQYIETLRCNAFSEDCMANWTFARDDGANERISGAMRRYADNFAMFREKGKGLLLYGPVGTGKTFAACCVANALIDKGVPCHVTNFSRLANTIQGMFEGKQEYLDSLSRYSLLVIDDLGAERKSEYMQETVFNIIDARYRSGKPMIITTNLSIEQIKNPENQQFSRIYDRIIERCFPVEVKGKSRRRAAVREDYQDIKSVLGL